MSPRHRLELFVRSLGTEGSNPLVATVIERLDQLVATETISDYEVHIVGRAIRPDIAAETVPGRFICERVVAFREWARRNGVSLEPFIETRHVTSEFTGDDYRTIAFPSVVLAKLEGERPRAVAPCATGERTYGVGDLIDALASEGDDDYPQDGPQADEPRPSRLSALEAALGGDSPTGQ